jgi:predicted RNA-binding protein with PIN domain
VVRVGQGRRGAGRRRDRGPELTVSDEALRPALEAAIEVARAAASTQQRQPAAPLRPLLKLRHLPERALPSVRRALEDDDLFRTVVAAATTEQLVGRVSWLWLERPEGWEDELAAATEAQVVVDAAAEEARAGATALRRLAAVEESLRRAEAEVASLRSKVSGLKERLADEQRARRAADTDAGRLRRQVADLEAASAALDAPHPAVAERDALVHQIGRLEAALASAEPPAPPSREPVQRALAALDRVRDELGDWLTDEPHRAHRATTEGRRPVPLPPATFDDTVQAADHLVRVPGVVVLVDGYNVSLGAHPELALAEQRAWLLDVLGGLAARCGSEVHVVFDGAEGSATAPAHGPRRTAVHVRYTEAGVEADDDLLALAADVPAHRAVVVVSDDRRVREGAARLGANVVGSTTLADLLRR